MNIWEKCIIEKEKRLRERIIDSGERTHEKDSQNEEKMIFFSVFKKKFSRARKTVRDGRTFPLLFPIFFSSSPI